MTRSRLDMTFVRAGLAPVAAELAVALLGEPNRSMSGKRELRFGNHGSVSVVIAGPKAGVWHDHELGVGGDLLALIMRERGGSFRDAIEFAEQFIGQTPREPAAAPQVRHRDAAAEDHTALALKIWKDAVPIASTIAELYLASRGIVELAPDIDGAVLRFHPSCRYGGVRHPCLIAPMRDIRTNDPRAIQRTALMPDGKKIGRMTLGPKTGAAIKLSADMDVVNRLTVGEGLETVLAGMALGYVPAWAVGDAGELAAFPVLSGIDSLTILVDHDKSGRGQQAAQECSKRWTSEGRDVFRLIPRRPGADANDLLLAGENRQAFPLEAGDTLEHGRMCDTQTLGDVSRPRFFMSRIRRVVAMERWTNGSEIFTWCSVQRLPQAEKRPSPAHWSATCTVHWSPRGRLHSGRN